MTRSRRAPVVAAGALVWREREGRLEVLLIHRPRYRDWSWPKGKRDPGEATPAAAVREVAEETGLEVALGAPLPMLRYTLRSGRPKEVHYWAATVLPDGAPSLRARPAVERSPDEVDDMRWLPPEKAAKKLSRRADRKPLDALVALHEKGRLATNAVVILRHAQARSRSSWDGSEADRPLAPSGLVQADAVVPVLAAYGVGALVTSPWQRCTATIAPFATASGIVPVTRSALTEDAHQAAPERVRQIAREVLGAGREVRDREREGPDTGPEDAGTGTGIVVCTHRPVLPTILEQLDEIAPGWVRRARPRTDPYLRPASAVIVHVARGARDGPRVTSLEIQGAERRK